MKKEMKYKVLLCLLAGSVLSVNTALAAEYTEQIRGDKDNYRSEVKTSDGQGTYTYDFGENAELKIDSVNEGAIYIGRGNKTVQKIEINDALDITVTNKDNSNTSYGIQINGGSGINGVAINRSDGGNITVDVENNIGNYLSLAYGVRIINGADNVVNLGNTKLSINSVNSLYEVFTCGLEIVNSERSKIIMGNGSITTMAKSDSLTGIPLDSTGVSMDSGATFEAGDVVLNSYAEGAGSLMSQGLYVEGTDTVAGMGIVDINAKSVGGERGKYVNTIGVRAVDNGQINIAGGSIAAHAYSKDGVTKNENAVVYAIWGQSSSEININRNTTNDVEIYGDVRNDKSIINLNLNTANSKINGRISDNDVHNYGTNLLLANGAMWSNTGASNVKSVSISGGSINQISDKDITVHHYSGAGDINFAAANTDNDGVLNLANTGDVIIGNARKGSSVNLGIINNTVNTLDIEKTEENLNAIANKIFYDANDGNLDGKVTVKEGLITPEASGDLLFDTTNNNRGYVTNITGGNRVTKTMDAMKHIAETAIVAWRQEDSTLSQRLGDLRESDGGQGIWVRMSRGEFNYDSQYENQYNFFQLGYDWARGNWHYGAAVSHNDGETTYAQGMGENRSTSLSLYGTWLGRNGHYADIVLKQGRLSNDFDIYTEAGHTHGDYDMWGTSLSGEYGRKIDLKDGWYVTPQAQMTLMRIGGEDFTTNNGIHVRQDSLESAVGRVGFEVGKAFDKKGSIYAKASLLHDFAGSADTYLSLKGLSNSYSQDIGDTWWEAGLGFNYKVNDSSYLYADVVKTFGGDVETPWQWNVGMRWAFV